MRLIAGVKHHIAVFILKLFGVDAKKEYEQRKAEAINKTLAEIGMRLRVSGTLSVIDANGNSK